MKPEDIEITDTNDRGFHRYGDPLTCTYGNTARVVESSAASGPHVWLFAETGPHMRREPGEVGLHLNEEQARGLIARLQAWVDEIPERWSLSEQETEEPGGLVFGQVVDISALYPNGCRACGSAYQVQPSGLCASCEAAERGVDPPMEEAGQ